MVQRYSYTPANSGRLQKTRHYPPHLIISNPASTSGNLASSGAGDVGALVALLATSDANTRPLPVRAGALTTENVDRDSLRCNVTLDPVDGQASDRDTSGRRAGRRAVLVVLLDHDSVLENLGNVSFGYDFLRTAMRVLTFLRVMFL
jgi:hypothetical protein